MKTAKDLILPEQVIPFPLKPELQAQAKLPYVLVHDALESQLWIRVAHSSTSECKKVIKITENMKSLISILND